MTKQDHDTLKEVARFHQDWIKVCKTYVGDLAEDMVQDTYLKLHNGNWLKRIRYKDSINKYFVYLALRSTCLDFLRKRTTKQEIINLPIEENQESYAAMDILFKKIHDEMQTWHSYDRKLMEMYMFSGLSYRDLAYGTEKTARLIANDKKISNLAVKNGSKISVNSIYTTIKHCKKKLKQELGEDFEDFYNGEYELIKIK